MVNPGLKLAHNGNKADIHVNKTVRPNGAFEYLTKCIDMFVNLKLNSEIFQ